jgi:hypothetical protein
VTEDRQAASTAGAEGATGDAVAPTGAQTVEEAEAIFRARMSGKDKSHNAETAALRAQIAALSAPAAPVGESPEAAQIRVLKAERDAAIAQAQGEALKRQYPLTADVLGDEVTKLPPEKLAGLEARFNTEMGIEGPAPRVDHNMAARGNGSIQSPAAKPYSEKTKDELLADLQAVAPAFQAAVREGDVS